MWRWGLALLLVSDLGPLGGMARADDATVVSGLDSLLQAEERVGFSGLVLVARGLRRPLDGP